MRITIRSARYTWSQYSRFLETQAQFVRHLDESAHLSEQERHHLMTALTGELDVDYSYEEFIERTAVFPHMLRRLSFLGAFMLMESQLGEVCDDVVRELDLPFTKADRWGGTLDQAKKYLSRTAKAELGRVSQWQTMRSLSDLRNRFVHANGALPLGKAGESLGRFVADTPHLSIGSGLRSHIIIVGEGFPAFAAWIMQDFIKEIVGLVWPKVQVGEPSGTTSPATIRADLITGD